MEEEWEQIEQIKDDLERKAVLLGVHPGEPGTCLGLDVNIASNLVIKE